MQPRIDLKFYGFYIGELKAPSAQFDARYFFARQGFFRSLPSYHAFITRSLRTGLMNSRIIREDLLALLREHQFRVDGTVMFSVNKFENLRAQHVCSERFLPNLHLRGKVSSRKRDQPLSQSDRRSRIPCGWGATSGNPSRPTEAFYDQGSGWTKNRAWTGVTVPIEKHVSFQPSYMWENTNGIKDLRYLMFGLIFRMPSR